MKSSIGQWSLVGASGGEGGGVNVTLILQGSGEVDVPIVKKRCLSPTSLTAGK